MKIKKIGGKILLLSQKFTILALFKHLDTESTVLNICIMNLCKFAQVIISRCTKAASTIDWWNENACSSDDLKLDIPAHSQLFTTQTRHTLYHTFMEKYPKMQISFEKFKDKLPRIQKYITNSKYWKHSNTNGEKMEFNWLYSLRSWFKLPEHYKKQHQIEDCDKCQSIISNAILHTRSASEGTT